MAALATSATAVTTVWATLGGGSAGITRVSVASDGTQGNAQTGGRAAIDADGRFVAFASSADNLVPGDKNDTADAFVHDRQTGATERVSVASDGTEGDRSSGGWIDISGNGRFVLFASFASNMAPGATNGLDAFVHDRQTGVTEHVAVTSDGTPPNGQLEIPWGLTRTAVTS